VAEGLFISVRDNWNPSTFNQVVVDKDKEWVGGREGGGSWGGRGSGKLKLDNVRLGNKIRLEVDMIQDELEKFLSPYHIIQHQANSQNEQEYEAQVSVGSAALWDIPPS
jgi:hypothetical protein